MMLKYKFTYLRSDLTRSRLLSSIPSYVDNQYNQSQTMCTVFTWLNAVATINHLCKMTVATIQRWLLFKGGMYCNVIMIAVATTQKLDSLRYK